MSILAATSSSLIALSILTTAAMAIACAALSVFVIARRWAFIGEGISHAGLGGAGTAWVLMLAIPTLVNQAWLIPVTVVIFCLGTALAIGYFSRGDRVKSDAAIGIFLVASLAWGFLAREMYQHFRHLDPVGFGEILFGRLSALPSEYALAALGISAAVIITLTALGKEILYYCFDPLMAQASGVRAGFIHYLLMVLLALTIVVGIPVVGSVMVTALLVLPGATAALVTQKLKSALIASCAIGLFGVLAGVTVNLNWRFIPSGPVIVLALFVEFVVIYATARARRITL